MTVVEMDSVRKQKTTNMFHGKAGDSLIIAAPDEHETIDLLRRVELRRTQNFLRHVICAQSPYDPHYLLALLRSRLVVNFG